MELLLGKPLAEKLSSHFNNLRELESLEETFSSKGAFVFSGDEIERVQALAGLLWKNGDEAFENPPIFVDRLSELAEPLGKLLRKDPENETFACIYLGEKNRLLNICEIATGNRHDLTFEFRKIFVEGCKRDAKSIILAHNHVISSFEPSYHDIETTRQAVAAGEILGIPVIDHIIMCPSDEEPGYWDFRSMVGLNKFPQSAVKKTVVIEP